MSGANTKPQTGMRRIPLTEESYEHPSLPLTSKRLVNLMLERAPADARTETPLLSTPSLTLYVSIGTGPIWALNDDLAGILYVVSGTHFYRVRFGLESGLAIDDLGDVGTPEAGFDHWNAFRTIAVGPKVAVVCVAPKAFTCAHGAADTLTEITGDVFGGATSVTYCDGYYAFTSATNAEQWFISKLLDPTDFDALDFVSSDAAPNVLRRLVTHRGQIWVIGDGGFEVWYDAGSSGLETTSGTSFFPFRRASGGVVPIGTNSPLSICRVDQSLFWLGWDGIVYRSNGYEPKRVSTHAIEAIIGSWTVFGQVALAHSYRGHWFYCLSVGEEDRPVRTLVYDAATEKWHERSTSTDGSLPWQARQAAAVSTNSLHLLGDSTNGNLYSLAMSDFDAGLRVIRQAVLPPLWANTNRAFCARVEIEMEVGTATGSVQLDWSDDGARTWGTRRFLSSGDASSDPSQYRKRVYTTRLGSFRQRTFRITSHGLTRIYAVDADIVSGVH